MRGIPADIYERVREFALGIVNALEVGDDAVADSLRGAFRSYYEEQATAGRFHPFLTEAMGDYTDDPVEAVRLYKLSLEEAGSFPGEPICTKAISLAERLLELGQKEQAEAYLRDRRLDAIRWGDQDSVKEADRLLTELARRTGR